MILTAQSSADLIASAFDLYVKAGSVILDVTYGKGVFWQKLDRSNYTVLTSDIKDGIDFRSLPQEDRSIDVILFDPPFMHGGETIKESIQSCYNSKNDSHESVIRLYAGGLLEAARVLKKDGLILVKCQDEIESAKQRWSHEEVGQLLDLFGFLRLDLFVFVPWSIPAMREQYQNTARKNHSYLIVAKFRR